MTGYTAGDRVSHSTYGDGTIVSVNEYHTRISFDAEGERTFVSSRVVLAPSQTPAPVVATKTRRKRAVAK
jgi:hypothetical protein